MRKYYAARLHTYKLHMPKLLRMFMVIPISPGIGKRLRMRIARKWSQKHKDFCTVLDLGGGLGELSIYYGTLQKKVVHVDINRKICTSLNLTAKKFNLEVTSKIKDINKLPENGIGIAEFDLILMLNVIDYLDKPDLVLNWLVTSMKQHSCLIISFPKKELSFLKSWKGINVEAQQNGFDFNKFLVDSGNLNALEVIEFREFLDLRVAKYSAKFVKFLSKLRINPKVNLILISLFFAPVLGILEKSQNKKSEEIWMLKKL